MQSETQSKRTKIDARHQMTYLKIVFGVFGLDSRETRQIQSQHILSVMGFKYYLDTVGFGNLK